MNRFAIAAGFALLAVWAVANAAESQAEKRIPLSSIFTTSPQADVEAFEVAFPNEDERRKLFQQISAFSSGASNVFLVDATNKLDAFKATLSVLEGSHSADTPAPVNAGEPERGSHWLVVYLGVGPSEPVWSVVEAVNVRRKTMRVNYHHPKANIVTRDVWRYYYWIPLGTLDPGNYQLELYNTKEKAVVLSRRVTVKSDKYN
ncbi:MAG: hypothetical protein IT425_01125 [Pirellulales bacterium]|nr:hypothetical protein [Pirellulales bacterium]